MKKSYLKIFTAFLLVLLTVAGMSVTLFGAESAPLNGWHTDENGVERYYENGSYVTGKKKIGSFTYIFGSDGAYINIYDQPKAIGTVGVMDTDGYKNAISALGSKVYMSMPIESGVNKVKYNNSGEYVDIVSGAYNETTSEKSNFIINAADPSGSYINVHLKNSRFDFVSKSNGKTAIKTTQALTATDPFINVNLSSSKRCPAGEDYVFEAEYKLGENFKMIKNDISLMQIIDRRYPETVVNGETKKENVFISLLNMNSEGMVYASNFSTSKFFCQLTDGEYTRISVSVHPSRNTYDVYVNGVLIIEGITYVSSSAWYDADKIVVGEVRLFQYGGEYIGTSMCVDNIYVYGASKPVCTEIAEPRNGVYTDESSAYLRYYENNLLIGGRVELNGTYFGRTFNKETVVFDKCGRYFVGNTASLVINGEVTKTQSVFANLFVGPSSTGVSEDRMFLGWRVTDASGSVSFLRKDESLRISSDITYEPVALSFDMLNGASVKTDKSSACLRYIARISKSEYDMLTSFGFTVEAHILTMPAEYIEKTYGYTTLDALKDLDSSVYNEWKDHKSEGWYHTTDNYYYYTASVADIQTENYMRDYSAVGYLKLIDPHGEETFIYTDYSEENNARNIYEVASKAYNDRILKKGFSEYSQKITFNGKKTYSPYSKERLDAVKSFADMIIDLRADETGVRQSGEYYEAPYTLSVVDAFGEFSITVKNTGDWLLEKAVAFILNGEVVSSGDELKGSEYSYTVEHEGEVISTDGSDDGQSSIEKWYMFDVETSADKKYFNYGKQRFPSEAPNGESSGFVWNYSQRSITLFNNSSTGFGWSMDDAGNADEIRYTPKNGSGITAKVVDMSDWVNLEFWVYAKKEDVGSGFIVVFYSENPAVDGSDYYSYSVILSNEGWNRVKISKTDMNVSRSPLGWDQITAVSFSSTGWNMEDHNGDYSQTLYLTSAMFDNDSAMYIENADRLEGTASFYPNGHSGVINGMVYAIDESNKSVTVFKDGETYYLPANVFAAALGYSAKWYKVGSVVATELEDGTEYRLAPGKEYTKNGDVLKYKKTAKVRDGMLFISAEDAMEIFGYSEMYVDRMGLVVLSNTKDIFDPTADYDMLYDVIEACIYVRPTGEQMYDDLMANSGGVHPYIMLDQADFDRLNYYKKKEPTLRSYISRLSASYDVGGSVYSKAPVEYSLTDGVRLLAISREAMERTKGFSLLYKLYEFDDPSRAELIAERLWRELESVCSFKDWHPAHYLDTAEMAYAVVLGYDWLYDYWVEYDKANGTNRLETIEKALYNYSLKTTTALGGTYNLAGSTNNWNGVCNGGTMAAALALVTNPKYKADAMTVMETSILAVEKGMWVYGPDGGYEEGPGYWSYGTTYLSVFMSALDSACGSDYGLYYAPGFAHSVYFTTYLGTMNTTWGFHDGGSGSADTNIAAWFALKSNDGNVNAIRRQAIENGWKGSSWYDIIWFSPHIVNNNITLDLDAYYSLDTVLTFRDSWDEKNSIFAGLHGGDNQASHGDLDIGNFIISVDGTHLICDLGSEKYNVAGYFGNYRWSYYRKRAEGQNTLVMLPHGESWDGKTGVPYADPITNAQSSNNKPVGDQKVNAVSKCLRYETGKNSALGVIDMKPAYSDYIASDKTAIRGLWFKDDRSTIIIQDEGTYKQGMDIWWFAHTKGTITVSEDGKSAIIEQNGIYLYAELVTNIADATFYVSEAESLDKNYVGDTTPSAIDPSTGSNYFKDDTESSRDGITKLCVKATNVTEYKLAVVFKVISGMYNTPERGTTYTWTDIKDWKVD